MTDAGSGSGRVIDATEDGALIDCPGQCTTDMEDGASIELLAEEDEGSRFVGWGTDACPAEPSCTVAGDTDVTLVPRFEEVVRLAVVLEGASFPEAQVAIEVGEALIPWIEFDPGEPCFDRCVYDLPSGATVTLTAAAVAPWGFDAWDTQALCDGTAEPCVVTVVENLTVVALYQPPVRLSVAVTGAGQVLSEAAGIDCPGRCEADLAAGSVVVLEAMEAPGWTLGAWTGACPPPSATGTVNPRSPICELQLDRPLSATATFVLNIR